MESFSFHNPTRIEFGPGKEDLIGQEVASAGFRKVLLCYGSERIRQSGLFDRVSGQLAAQGVAVVALGGIVSNPLLGKVREGIALARAEGVDAILAVGGGSVLDSVKAMAAGVCYPGDVWDLFVGKAPVSAALPIFAILTLAATGSEMNPGAVVTNELTREKFFILAPVLFPRLSIVNPALMAGVPRDYLVYSAADVIAHLIEGYFSATIHPPLASRLVESLILTVMETTGALLENPDDLDARGQFAWAATLALNGLTFAGVAGAGYPNHAIEHALSALFNVPHGAGLSVVVPAWMAWYRHRNPQQFERFARQVFGVTGNDPVAVGEAGIAALKAWFDRIGTPTRLAQLGIGQDDLPAIVANVGGNMQVFGLTDTYPPEAVATILAGALG